MRALVTGAFGFAGLHLVDYLRALGDDVTALGLGNTHAIPFVTVGTLDVTNLEGCRAAIRTFQPEIVYHLAGISYVPHAERDFRKTVTANVVGAHNILQACCDERPGTRVLLISSAEVYGKVLPSELPLKETSPLRPGTNYSVSKVMLETVADRFRANGQVTPVVIRSFNHIGRGQRQDFVIPNFAFQLAKIRRGEADPILRVGNLEARRDFTDVRDIVVGYKLAAEKGAGTYNMCSGRSYAISEMLEKLITISGVTVQIERDPLRFRPVDVPEIVGSYDRIKQDLGWAPKINIEHTLRDIFEEAFEAEDEDEEPIIATLRS